MKQYSNASTWWSKRPKLPLVDQHDHRYLCDPSDKVVNDSVILWSHHQSEEVSRCCWDSWFMLNWSLMSKLLVIDRLAHFHNFSSSFPYLAIHSKTKRAIESFDVMTKMQMIAIKQYTIKPFANFVFYICLL